MMATIRLSKSPSAKCFRRDKPETMHPALPGASRLQFLLRGPADCLRRLTEGAQESAAHAFTIGKAGFAGDGIDRMAALFHHQAGRFQPQVLDSLGRRLTRFGAEGAAELAGAEMCGFGQFFDGERRFQIAARMGKRLLDAVGFRFQFQKG
jgi:hypothetical protein